MSRVPVVRPGEPDEKKKYHYDNTEIDGVTLWYDKNVRADKENEPILVDGHKVLFGYQLDVLGARQFVKEI